MNILCVIDSMSNRFMQLIHNEPVLVSNIYRSIPASMTLTPSKTVNEGEDVTLFCSAKACPTSEITWKKNGNTLAGITGSTLQILSVKMDDTGEYSCHATFWKTTKSANMTLTMNRKHYLYLCTETRQGISIPTSVLEEIYCKGIIAGVMYGIATQPPQSASL